MTKKDCETLADLLYPDVKPYTYYIEKYKPRKVSGEVTRVAPSPTGFLHIGTIYQALIDKLTARDGGVFVLRLEDTDNKREIKDAGNIAYDMLCRFNLAPDEGYAGDNLKPTGNYGPYVQSKRLKIYHSFAHELVKRGRAFPCFCGNAEGKEEILKRRAEELENSDTISEKDPCRNLTLAKIKKNLELNKTFALRLRSNGDGTKTKELSDLIMGKKELRENAKDDVLIKSNGIPVYAFAHIVDDLLMHTTIIVRGQDWYQSLPVHVELCEAFGFKPFKYAHTPNICVLNELGNKRKISKRKDPFADARIYLEQGYPVDAVIEYLLNLLNSNFEMWRKANPTLPYTDFPFDIKKIGVNNPMFDFAKLDDVSKGVISRLSANDVYTNAVNWAKDWNQDAYNILVKNKNALLAVLNIGRNAERPRKDISKYSEILSLYDYVLPKFKPDYSNLVYNNTDKTKLKQFLLEYANNYLNNTDLAKLDNSIWFDDLKVVAFKFNFADNKTYKQDPIKFSGSITDASKFLRLAITGKENSPELFAIMQILGKEKCVKRILNFVEYIK